MVIEVAFGQDKIGFCKNEVDFTLIKSDLIFFDFTENLNLLYD